METLVWDVVWKCPFPSAVEDERHMQWLAASGEPGLGGGEPPRTPRTFFPVCIAHATCWPVPQSWTSLVGGQGQGNTFSPIQVHSA